MGVFFSGCQSNRPPQRTLPANAPSLVEFAKAWRARREARSSHALAAEEIALIQFSFDSQTCFVYHYCLWADRRLITRSHEIVANMEEK